MCVDGDILDSRMWKNYETNIFFHVFDVDLRSKLVLCMNKWWTIKKRIRTFKNIKTYLRNLNKHYHALILN